MTSIYLEDYQRLLGQLVAARKRSGVTQQELAKRLRRPQSFVSKFENGERRLDVVEFVKIARLMGVEPNKLLKAIE